MTEVKVILTHPIIGDIEFDPDHAERLLTMFERTDKPNGGWKLKEATDGNDADSARDKGSAKRGRTKSSED